MVSSRLRPFDWTGCFRRFKRTSWNVSRLRSWLEETLSKHSNKSVEDINRDIDRDKILTAAEALEYGLIDQVLTSRKGGAVPGPQPVAAS